MRYWRRFSKKLKDRLDRPRFSGKCREASGMRYVFAREEKGENVLALHWLVDEEDGVIAEAKYQVVGQIGLIGALEVASELVLRKTYDQASRLTTDLIDQHVRDRKDASAFPKECDAMLNLVLAAIDKAVEKCAGIPFTVTHDITPIERDFQEIPGGIPGWLEMAKEVQRKIIEEVVDKEIRPYVELDAGGINIVAYDMPDIVISYEGACTTCHSSTGSTLTAVQQILRARVHPDLRVTPQL